MLGGSGGTLTFNDPQGYGQVGKTSIMNNRTGFELISTATAADLFSWFEVAVAEPLATKHILWHHIPQHQLHSAFWFCFLRVVAVEYDAGPAARRLSTNYLAGKGFVRKKLEIAMGTHS